jgi:hypothetical protein
MATRMTIRGFKGELHAPRDEALNQNIAPAAKDGRTT